MNTDKNNAQLPQSSVSVSAFLNGKAKLDFEKWLKKQPYVYFNKYTKLIIIHNKVYSELNQLFINTLYLEWFDNIGFHIGRDMVDNYWLENSTFFERLELNGYDYISVLKSVSEAIEKANELYNAHFLADTQAEH